MKTLDEVIKGIECCKEINCAECPYANWDNTDIVRCDPSDKEDDALIYLKSYMLMTSNNLMIGTGIDKVTDKKPTAHWILSGTVQCSTCGYVSDIETDVCPSCGSRMA